MAQTPEDLSLQIHQHHLKYRLEHGSDKILNTIRRHIDDLSARDFAYFQVAIQVQPKANAKILRDGHGHALGYDEYNIETFGTEAQSMRVRLNRSQDLEAFQGIWFKLPDFLAHLNTPDLSSAWPCPTAVAYDQLWAWWKINGKKFKLLLLPPEIRELLYTFALPGKITIPHVTRLSWSPATIKSVMPLILLISRQVYAEASYVHQKSALYVIGHRASPRTIQLKPSLGKVVQNLQLSLSHEHFLDLFRTASGSTQDRSGRSTPRSASCIRSLQLKKLVMEFDRPSIAVRTNFGLKRVACQVKVVDFIMRIALPWLSGQPVSVSGSVKAYQKLGFEAKCASERAEWLRWSKMRPLDWEERQTLADWDSWKALEEEGVPLAASTGTARAEEVSRQALAMSALPLCSCPTLCDSDSWSE